MGSRDDGQVQLEVIEVDDVQIGSDNLINWVICHVCIVTLII
jgi:hypothetical protein